MLRTAKNLIYILFYIIGIFLFLIVSLAYIAGLLSQE
jgi:hypothetical protein